MSEENNNTQSSTTESPKTEAVSVEITQTTSSNDNAIAALAYILFFVPLLIEPKTEFKTFHANQGLLLLIYFAGGSILSIILAIVLIGVLLGFLISISSFVFLIIGVVNALNGKKERLPIIGQWDLLK